MFDFQQYLGFLAFLGIATIGFWLMIFLLTFVVPYWVGGSLMEFLKERREAKRAARRKKCNSLCSTSKSIEIFAEVIYSIFAKVFFVLKIS